MSLKVCRNNKFRQEKNEMTFKTPSEVWAGNAADSFSISLLELEQKIAHVKLWGIWDRAMESRLCHCTVKIWISVSQVAAVNVFKWETGSRSYTMFSLSINRNFSSLPISLHKFVSAKMLNGRVANLERFSCY